jgi:signal transduction histidine kinase
VLRTELELANQPGRSRAELAESVREAAREADRVARLAEDLLFLARTDRGGPTCIRSASHCVRCSPVR